MGPDVIPWAGDLDAAGRIRWGRWQSSIRLDQSGDQQRRRTFNCLSRKKTHGASKHSVMERQLLMAVRKCVKYRSQWSPKNAQGL